MLITSKKGRSSSYTQGVADGNAGVKSRIDESNNPNNVHPASRDYLEGYKAGKQAFDARTKEQ